MKYVNDCCGSKATWPAALTMLVCLSISVESQAGKIAGEKFDDNAFVDTLVSFSGDFGPTEWFSAAVGAGDETAIIGADIDSFAHALSKDSYLEIGFTDNVVVNGPGDDLVIFELGNILEPHFVALSVADLLSDTNVVQVDSEPTGKFNSLGVAINRASLDLSDLGVAEGAAVTSLAFTSECDLSTENRTGGACQAGDRNLAATAVIGAIHSEIATLDPLEKYDNFNSKKVRGCKGCIDSQKWIGFDRGDYLAEIHRAVVSKRLLLSHRSWGNTDSDAGTEQARNRMRIRDSESVSGVCFTPRVRRYELNQCAENQDASKVRVRYLGNLYDTDGNDDGDDGLIYAGIALVRDSDSGAKATKFSIEAWATQCADEDCETETWSTYDDIDDPDLSFGSTKASANKKPLCISYDSANHKLVFSYGDDVRHVNALEHGLPAFDSFPTNEETWHVIETRTDVPNCSAGMISGSIEADVDDVMLRRRP